MSGPRLSIPTRYNGQLFRSKLEADWARSLDGLSIPWEYEREGTYYGDVFYLPDFWLPQSQQFLEVKAVLDRHSFKKIVALLSHHEFHRDLNGNDQFRADFRLILGWPFGEFNAIGSYRRPAEAAPLAEPMMETRPGYSFLLHYRSRIILAADDSSAFQCRACERIWFGDTTKAFQCRCCGAWDGDGHIAKYIRSPLPAWLGSAAKGSAG